MRCHSDSAYGVHIALHTISLMYMQIVCHITDVTILSVMYDNLTSAEINDRSSLAFYMTHGDVKKLRYEKREHYHKTERVSKKRNGTM